MKIEKCYVVERGTENLKPIPHFIPQWQVYQDKMGGDSVVGDSLLKCILKYWTAWLKHRSWRRWFTSDPTQDLLVDTFRRVCAIEKRLAGNKKKEISDVHSLHQYDIKEVAQAVSAATAQGFNIKNKY